MLSNSDTDTLPDYAHRIRVLRSFLHRRGVERMDLYTHGGRHPKDIEVARELHHISALLASVFPESDTSA